MNRATVALVVLVGCGDPIVGSQYRGEPIFRVTGEIESIGPGVSLGEGEEALVSMFWATDLSKMPPDLVAQDSVSAAVQFPSSFEVRVFDAPGEEHLVASDGRFGVGVLLVYVDADGDHSFDSAEKLIGGGISKAIVWAKEIVPATESPFAVELPEGFSLVEQPFATCMPPPGRGGPIGPPDGESHVGACTEDAMCPSGLICDRVFRVCVPKDSVKIIIGPEFDLARIRCTMP